MIKSFMAEKVENGWVFQTVMEVTADDPANIMGMNKDIGVELVEKTFIFACLEQVTKFIENLDK